MRALQVRCRGDTMERMRGPPLVAAILYVAFETPGRAQADPPACFPERMVLHSAPVFDSRGREVGLLRAGYVVKVVDDRVGDGKAWADVELTGPVAGRVRIKREELLVFATSDLSAVPGFSWWLAGFPLEILDEDDGRIQVRGSSPLHLDAPFEASWATCANVRATPTLPLIVSWCNGAQVVWERVPDGKRVWWEASRVTLERDGHTYVSHAQRGKLIEVKGTLSLVEVIEDWDGVRVQGYIASEMLREDTPPDLGLARGTGWCPDFAIQTTNGKRGRTVHDTELHMNAVATGLALPAFTPVEVLGKKGGWAEVRVTWPGTRLEDAQLILQGWIPLRALGKRRP